MLTRRASRSVFVLCCTAMMLSSFQAAADVPTAGHSTLPEMITVVPDVPPWPLATSNLVNVAGSEGPVTGALCELVFDATAQGLLQWCGGTPLASVSTVTDGNGDAEFVILGGGCIVGTDPDLVVPIVPVQVFADGVYLGDCDINSPDVVNSGGLKVTHPSFAPDTNGASQPISTVAIGDAVFHTPAVINNLPEPCTVFTGDPVSNGVSLSDAQVITNYVLNASTCTL